MAAIPINDHDDVTKLDTTQKTEEELTNNFQQELEKLLAENAKKEGTEQTLAELIERELPKSEFKQYQNTLNGSQDNTDLHDSSLDAVLFIALIGGAMLLSGIIARSIAIDYANDCVS